MQNKRSPLDFQAAALLYSLGRCQIVEATRVAEQFRHQLTLDHQAGTTSPQSPAEKALTGSNADLNDLRFPALQVPAKVSIMALAQGLARETTDPFKDIFEVRNFVIAVSDFLSEAEFEKAGIFVQMGDTQCELGELDPQGRSEEAIKMREEIRQAAIEYISNPLNQDTPS